MMSASLFFLPSNVNSSESILSDLARVEALTYVDIDKASHLIEQLQEPQNSSEAIEHYLLLSARILANQGEIKQARQRLVRLLRRSISKNSQVEAYYLHARMFQLEHKFDKAFEYLNYFIKVGPEDVSVFNQVRMLSIAAELKVEALDFVGAENYLSQAIDIADQFGSTLERCYAYGTMAYAYVAISPNEAFEKVSDQAIALCQLANARVLLISLYGDQAAYFQHNSNFQRQRELAEKSLALQLGKSVSVVNRLQTKLLLLDAHVNLKQWHIAKELLNNALVDIAIDPPRADLGELARLDSIISIGLGDLERGIAQYKRYLSFVVKSDITIRDESYQYHHETSNHVEEVRSNQLTSLRAKISELQKHNDEMLFKRLMLLAALVVFIIFIGILTFRSSQKITTISDQKTDALTGLYFYRDCFSYLMSQKSLVYNPKQQFAALSIDIDAFGTFNNSFGHHQGDLLLAKFANLMKSRLKDIGVVVRQRDDRFIIFLANCDHQYVTSISNETLMLLNDYGDGSMDCNLKVNIGWYYSEGSDVTSANELNYGVACANKALLQGKEIMRGSAIEYLSGNNELTQSQLNEQQADGSLIISSL